MSFQEYIATCLTCEQKRDMKNSEQYCFSCGNYICITCQHNYGVYMYDCGRCAQKICDNCYKYDKGCKSCDTDTGLRSYFNDSMIMKCETRAKLTSYCMLVAFYCVRNMHLNVNNAYYQEKIKNKEEIHIRVNNYSSKFVRPKLYLQPSDPSIYYVDIDGKMQEHDIENLVDEIIEMKKRWKAKLDEPKYFNLKRWYDLKVPPRVYCATVFTYRKKPFNMKENLKFIQQYIDSDCIAFLWNKLGYIQIINSDNRTYNVDIIKWFMKQ